MLDDITLYLSKDFALFPIHGIEAGRCLCSRGENCRTPGKHPSTPEGFKDATKDKELLLSWIKSRTSPNLGIATGESSGILVVDIDPRHGGFESIKKMNKQWPATPTVITGSGGEHRFFKYPRNLKIASSVDLLPGVDIRANGGYVVAVPSLHMSGHQYHWDDFLNLNSVEFADPPGWLLSLISERSKKTKKTPQDWRSHTSKFFGEGTRHRAIIELCGHLIGKKVDAVVALNLLSAFNKSRCQPSLETDELYEILAWVLKKHSERTHRYGK